MSRVLLVEDDPTVRGVIQILLATEPDLELVGSADTAEEAIALAERLQPDLVLLDNQLAGALTGLDAAPSIKAVSPGVLVLLCTALDLADQAALARPSVDAYLRKDGLHELVEHVQRLLGEQPGQPGSA